MKKKLKDYVVVGAVAIAYLVGSALATLMAEAGVGKK